MSIYQEYRRRSEDEFDSVLEMWRAFADDAGSLADWGEPDHVIRGMNLCTDARESGIQWMADLRVEAESLLEDMGYGYEFDHGYVIYKH
ncbi:hypothetical protein ACWF99_23725 [Nocardia sp. NPDC055002]